MNRQTALQKTQIKATPGATGILQRKCACGTHATGSKCDACGKKKGAQQLQRSAINSEPMSEAPPIVHDVLHSSGQPLDPATRAFFEPRFGQDFSRVRVHTDARAADSAKAVNALAYTVGRDVVFASGQYAPDTNTGRRLLAHELTHVVQQAGRLLRLSIAGEPQIVVGHEDEELEREAHRAARKIADDEEPSVLRRATAMSVQRAPDNKGDDSSPKVTPRDSDKEEELKTCVKTAGADPDECMPSRALTWADFQGTPGPESSAGAMTYSGNKTVAVPSQACMKKVTGKTTGPATRFQAFMDSSKSWVRAKYKNISDLAKNGGSKLVKKCEDFFDQQTAAGLSGGTWAMNTGPDAVCPASIPPRGDPATTKAGCTSVVGSDYIDYMKANSARLLSHEQGHFDITCVLVKKANVALAAGGDITKIGQALNTKRSETQTKYDNDGSHGCKATEQASWKQDIADGLKKITIP